MERYIFEVPNDRHLDRAQRALSIYRDSGYKAPHVLKFTRETRVDRYRVSRTKAGTWVVKQLEDRE